MDLIELFVPVIVAFFGGHTDWAGRCTEINVDVLPGKAGIDLGIYVTAEKSETFELSSLDETAMW